MMVGNPSYSKRKYANEAIEEFKKHHSCTVYVDPTDPTKAVLKTGVKQEHVLFPILGLVFIGLGIAIAIFVPYAIRQEEAKKKRLAAYQKERQRQEEVAADRKRSGAG